MNIVELIEKNGHKCSGCGLCVNLCPLKSLILEENKEGFLEPTFCNDLCISCGLCVKKCKEDNLILNKNQIYYGFQTRDSYILRNSSSGGVFGSFAKKIINNNGIVYGCKIKNDYSTVISRVDKIEDLKFLLGAKYVQSNVLNTFEKVKFDLDNGNNVIYCALPCQIEALRKYLNNIEYKNLLLIDIVCHGTPSHGLFRNYLKWKEGKIKKQIIHYGFRAKKAIPWGYECVIVTENKKGIKRKYIPYFLDKYFFAFSNGDNLCEKCYECKFSTLNRVSDITIGDFWNIGTQYAKKKNGEAISIVIVNTEKGNFYFDKYLTNDEFFLINKEDVINSNRELNGQKIRPKTRDVFYIGYLEGCTNFYKKMKVLINIKLILKYYIKLFFRRNR